MNEIEPVLAKAGKGIRSAISGEGGWAYNSTKSDVELHFNMCETEKGTTLKFTKGVTTIPTTPAIAAEIVTDFSCMTVWDKQFDTGEIIEELKVPGRVLFFSYQRFKAPWPVSYRDFCSVVETIYEKSGLVRIIATSHSNPKKPPDPSYVRANLFYGGWVFEPIDGKDNWCKATYVTAMDPEGTLPVWLVNQIANDTPMCLAAIRSFIEANPRKIAEMKKKAEDKADRRAAEGASEVSPEGIDQTEGKLASPPEEPAKEQVDAPDAQVDVPDAPVRQEGVQPPPSAPPASHKKPTGGIWRLFGRVAGFGGLGVGAFAASGMTPEVFDEALIASLSLLSLALLLLTPPFAKGAAVHFFPPPLLGLAITAITPAGQRDSLGSKFGITGFLEGGITVTTFLATLVAGVAYAIVIAVLKNQYTNKMRNQESGETGRGRTRPADQKARTSAQRETGGGGNGLRRDSERTRSRSQPPGVGRFVAAKRRLTTAKYRSGFPRIKGRGKSAIAKTKRADKKDEKDKKDPLKGKAWGQPEKDSRWYRRLNVRIIGSKVRRDFWGVHVRFVLEVRRGNHMFRIQRRYSEFHDLHICLSAKFGVETLQRCGFPPKTIFRDTSESFREQRKSDLNNYLDKLAEYEEIWRSKELYRFFLPNQKLPPQTPSFR
ncbi:hypothetical protein AAMO2058_001226300 [Amorphochlora amoebiformis]